VQTPRAGLPAFAKLLGAIDRPLGTDTDQRFELPDVTKLPILGPIVRRGLPDHVVASLIKDRLVRLLGRVAEAQKDIRTDRAQKMSTRIDVLRADIEKLETRDVASADKLFRTVGKLSTQLEQIIDDADYLSPRCAPRTSRCALRVCCGSRSASATQSAIPRSSRARSA
jgi:hypothetical protein